MDARSIERPGDDLLEAWRSREVSALRLERAPFPTHRFPMFLIQMNDSRTIGQRCRAVAAVAESVARTLGGTPAFPTKETP